MPREHWVGTSQHHHREGTRAGGGLWSPQGCPGCVHPFLCSWQTARAGRRALHRQSLPTPRGLIPEPSACAPWSPSATCTGPRLGTRAPKVRAGQRTPGHCCLGGAGPGTDPALLPTAAGNGPAPSGTRLHCLPHSPPHLPTLRPVPATTTCPCPGRPLFLALLGLLALASLVLATMAIYLSGTWDQAGQGEVDTVPHGAGGSGTAGGPSPASPVLPCSAAEPVGAGAGPVAGEPGGCHASAAGCQQAALGSPQRQRRAPLSCPSRGGGAPAFIAPSRSSLAASPPGHTGASLPLPCAVGEREGPARTGTCPGPSSTRQKAPSR